MFMNNIMLTNDLHDFHPGEDLSILTYISELSLLRDIHNYLTLSDLKLNRKLKIQITRVTSPHQKINKAMGIENVWLKF
jgi:hypothetical protein